MNTAPRRYNNTPHYDGQQYSTLRWENQNKQRDEITKTNEKILNICGNDTYLFN
jgi:hypothetical protein